MAERDVNQMFEILSPTNREMRVPENLKHYSINKLIWPSSKSLVLAANDNETHKKVAIKCIPIQIFHQNPKEFEIMSLFQDPLFVSGLDAFQYPETNPRFFAIVMPRATLDLLDYNNFHDYLKEKIVFTIMRNLIEALRILHERHVWHRNLKLDDILIKSETSNGPSIAICDFGDAAIIDTPEFEGPGIGTGEYGAPELFENKFPLFRKAKARYTEKIDIWSAGIIMYVLLFGRFPFSPFSEDDVMRMMKGEVIFEPPSEEDEEAVAQYEKISEEAKELISIMLNADPAKRPSAAEALKHPWFQMYPYVPPENENVIEGIINSLGNE